MTAFDVPVMDRSRITDLYFAEARSKLIDLAAFLDRVERSEGPPGNSFVGYFRYGSCGFCNSRSILFGSIIAQASGDAKQGGARG